MFVQNQIQDLTNHKAAISDAFDRAGEARLIVAYVRENGVDMILDDIRGKPVKLLCSLDMGITQLSGIRKLLENDVEVRIYKSNEGTFHPKVWLFKNNDQWKVLVGSANLTAAALVDNVEASVFIDDINITFSAVMFFNYLWEAKNSNDVTLEDISQLEEQLRKRQSIRRIGASLPLTTENESEKIQKLFSFVTDWIDISKSEQQGISSLWRGWYIIPDQGYVDDYLAESLTIYMRVIGDGVAIDRPMRDAHYKKHLHDQITNYFEKIKEKTAKNVRGNYVKNVKHTMSVIAWCNGFSMSDDFVITLSRDENQ